MASKSKDKNDGKAKTKKLKLQKATAKELNEGELDKVQGGVARSGKPL